MADESLKDFYLVGGTALSLKIGHRISIDIDLFTHKDFDAKAIGDTIAERYKPEEIQVIKNGVFTRTGGIKTDMIAHQYPLIKPVEETEGIRFISLEDIGAMKLEAIFQNGTRLKDFVDVYFLLEHTSLKEMTVAYEAKYPDANGKLAHNALLYHNDIEFDLPVKLLEGNLVWQPVAERLKEAVLSPLKIFSSQKLAERPSEKKRMPLKRNKSYRQGRGKRL